MAAGKRRGLFSFSILIATVFKFPHGFSQPEFANLVKYQPSPLAFFTMRNMQDFCKLRDGVAQFDGLFGFHVVEGL